MKAVYFLSDLDGRGCVAGGLCPAGGNHVGGRAIVSGLSHCRCGLFAFDSLSGIAEHVFLIDLFKYLIR